MSTMRGTVEFVAQTCAQGIFVWDHQPILVYQQVVMHGVPIDISSGQFPLIKKDRGFTISRKYRVDQQ
jgi:hypothetical protein